MITLNMYQLNQLMGESCCTSKKATDYKLRPDLVIYKKRKLESVFTEIIQKDSKNIVELDAYIDIHVYVTK